MKRFFLAVFLLSTLTVWVPAFGASAQETKPSTGLFTTRPIVPGIMASHTTGGRRRVTIACSPRDPYVAGCPRSGRFCESWERTSPSDRQVWIGKSPSSHISQNSETWAT